MLKGLFGNHSNGIIAMAVFVFVLTAVPKMNIRMGPVPLYLIDLLLALVVFYASKRPGFGAQTRPFQWVVMSLFGFAMIGEFIGFIYTGSIFEHAYTGARLTLAFLVFYAAGQLIRTPKDLELVIKAATLGVIVTSLLMVLTSLPQTRDVVTRLVLNNTFLEPGGRQGGGEALAAYNASIEGGVRGRTLIGVSILGASFINMSWPLAALLYCWPGPIGRWRNIAMMACFLAPMGVLMSYSRGPILGTILIIFFALFFGLKRVRKGILLPVIMGAGVILLVGVNSQIFFFDRLTNRTTAVFDNPYADERESERILAYVEPFEHVIENPEFLISGQGVAINKLYRLAIPESAGKATHALFGVAYYSYGMVAAFLYMFLLGSAFYYALQHVRTRRSGLGEYYSQALLLSLLGVAPWAVFGHAMVSQPRGAMMFFLVFGLLTTLRHFPVHSQSIQHKGTGHANSRHITV